MRFFGFREVEHVHPECLKRTVLNAFLEEGIDIERKLVGYMADSGTIKADIPPVLQKKMPYLISLNCASHRLEMAVKGIFHGTSFDNVNEMLHLLAKLYWTCPSRMHELKTLAQIMLEGETKPHQAEGTRWVQHKQRATRALLQAYPAVVCNLANMSTQTTLPKEKTIFQEYLRTLRSLNFVLHLLFYSEILEPIAKLSRSLQNSTVDLVYTASLLEKFYSTLERFSRGALHGPLHEVLEETEKDPQSVYFSGTRLQCEAEIAKAFKEKLPSYVATVSDCILHRFGALHLMEPIRCLKILEADQWPESPEDMENYGTVELQVFCRHFAKLLAINQVDVTKLLEEWEQFRQFRTECLAELSSQQMWQNMLTRDRARFPNFYHVIHILHCFPVSSVVLEWGYSAVTRLKAESRSKMSINTLEYLTRISVEGPEPDVFDPQAAVSLYCFEQMGFIADPVVKRTSMSVFSDEEISSPNKRACFTPEEYSSD
ncbi:ZN862 protein, partial [Atractosteus spatula]|nr:ZN862 protein [Atractosteus spatula]